MLRDSRIIFNFSIVLRIRHAEEGEESVYGLVALIFGSHFCPYKGPGFTLTRGLQT